MTFDLKNIEQLLHDCKTEEAISALKLAVTRLEGNDKAQAYYLLGLAYQKLSNWKEAITNYCHAMEINPDSPAAEASKAAYEILEFFNHDLYNP